MRKFYIFALIATMFAACATDGMNEPSAVIGDLTPETLTVSFEGEESRIQLQEGKTVWNEGDLVSVFYRSNANQKWQFQGATGDRTGNLKRVEIGTATETMNRVVVVYPYAENYYINPETYNIEASLPAQQTYVADSYGVGGNIMVSSGEYNQVVLKSVCGWLKLELTGNGEKISTITLKGNNGEQVAGQLYINSADATATLASEIGGADDNGSAGGNLVFEDTILKEVTLNCGEGVELSAEPTAFYIALPPQTFEKGLTAVFTSENGVAFEKSTDKAVVIERNTIQPMAAIEVPVEKAKPANNEIWYTNGSATEATRPYQTDVFGANIISNTYDTEKECWVIKFDGNVTSVGYYAFYQRNTLTSVTIPDSVTEIGYMPFKGCTSLTSVTIPDSVKSIGDYAFWKCTSLTSITIPDSVTSIGYKSFEDCTSLKDIYVNITDLSKYCTSNHMSEIPGNKHLLINGIEIRELVIPDNVTSIEESAFEGCTSLTSVTIGNGVTSIGNYAFYCCRNLTSVTIPNSVIEIKKWAFNGCSSLASVTIPDSVISIGEWAFNGCKSLTSVTIPDSVLEIGYHAFSNCSSLTSVTIGNGVIEIGVGAFSGCSRLQEFKGELKSEDGRCLIIDGVLNSFAIGCGATEYTIPDIVTSIGDLAFEGCSSLTSVTIPNTVITIGGRAFYGCKSLTSVTIGNRVTSIEYYAFYECESLESITIPDSVTEIGESAFYYCSNLKSVTFGGCVSRIEKEAFAGCSSLTSVTIPDSVLLIGEVAFCNCSGLTSVTIGNGSAASIENGPFSIEYGAFANCRSLTSVYCKATTPPSLDGDVFKYYNDGSFYNIGCKIYVPRNSVSAYKSAQYWSDYASSIAGYDF